MRHKRWNQYQYCIFYLHQESYSVEMDLPRLVQGPVDQEQHRQGLRGPYLDRQHVLYRHLEHQG